jgi:hypothetical protein
MKMTWRRLAAMPEGRAAAGGLVYALAGRLGGLDSNLDVFESSSASPLSAAGSTRSAAGRHSALP